jgi:hypothetical protein
LNFNGSTTQSFAITVEGGQRISFTVELLRDQEGTSTGAQVAVAVAETSLAQAASAATRRIFGFASEGPASSLRWWKPVSAFAVLALLFAGAWWVWTNRQSRVELVRVTPTPAPTVPMVNPSPAQQKGQEEPPPTNRAPGSATEPTATPTLAQSQPNARERNETFVARSLVADDSTSSDPSEFSTRGAWNRQSMGKPLNEVGRVYVQAVADNALNQELLAVIRARLATGGTVQDSGADQADAALKVSVRPASTRADDLRVSVMVRAVNANGYVVWPGARGGSRWRYIGQPRFVAERIVADLTKDIKSATH